MGARSPHSTAGCLLEVACLSLAACFIVSVFLAGLVQARTFVAKALPQCTAVVFGALLLIPNAQGVSEVGGQFRLQFSAQLRFRVEYLECSVLCCRSSQAIVVNVYSLECSDGMANVLWAQGPEFECTGSNLL